LNSPDKVQEIIIIKRGGEGEVGHHGGAWKIAFADFMTAMMALFLVLWLINAANEETKKAVASYFNPVKLVDRNRSVKGLHDAEGVQETEVKAPNEQFPEEKPISSPSDKQSKTESQYFADPFSALNEIAAHQAPGELRAIEEQGGRNGNDAINDAAGGEAFMDPFSPNFWNEEVRPSNNSGQLAGRYETDGQGEVADKNKTAPAAAGKGGKGSDGGNAHAGDQASGKENAGQMAAGEMKAGQEGMSAEKGVAAAEDPSQTAAIAKDAQAIPDKAGDAAKLEQAAAEARKAEAVAAEAEQMREKITEKLTEAFGKGSKFAGELTVVPSGDEILISLTDAFDISMFEVGSAIPSHDLVIALEKIGNVLGEQKGGIRIRGHTDARPFRSEDYDNWRLSAARAQSAYYMLLRGGLEETRVREISGFADRQLLLPEEPLSPKNRRIEVLVGVNTG